MKRLTAQKRFNLITEALRSKKKSVTQLCREFGVSRYTFYKWVKIWQKKGPQPQIEFFQDHYLKGERHWRAFSSKKKKAVLELAAARPNWSSQKISLYLSRNGLKVGNHGAQNVLKRNGLSHLEERQIYQKNQGVETISASRFSPARRLRMIEEVEKGKEKVSAVCRKLGISRYTFYKWYRRYLENPEEWFKTLSNQCLKGKNHPRFLGKEKERLVLDWVAQNPQYSCRRLLGVIPQISHHGIQKILERNDLNTYQKRLIFQQSLGPTATLTFVPVPAPAVTQPPKIWRFLKAPFATVPKLVRSPRALLLTLFFTLTSSFILYRWALMLSRASPGTQAGLVFATFALTFGLFFFIYSLKYYFTLILILGFSRQVSGGGNGNGVGHEDRIGDISRQPSDDTSIATDKRLTLVSDTSRSWWERIFGVSSSWRSAKGGPIGSHGNPVNGGDSIASLQNDRGEMGLQNDKRAGGLQPDLSHVKLERHPFVSIHLPLYNEKRVVERLLTAVTSQEYPNYEVVVVDDSNDGTTEIVKQFAERWNLKTKPYIKVIHRETREGYKGGALRLALSVCDPRTEFVVVFDADFLPYPDTITQFLKYFQVTAGTLDFSRVNANKMRMEMARMDANDISINLQNLNSPINSHVAAVQGYQWHVLNKSENWVTRGVRSEYAGSYVVERSAGEITGALKQIAGSVYMVRKDILDKYGWGVSLTEDFELTLRLYRDGYKVVYTPYIQTPSECVSTLKRLIRQRMRWAEGHSHNIKRMFTQMLFSSKLTLMEKLEFLYLSPYYLQALFFMVGTLSWFISEAVFHTKLPFWTSIWGWSLVFTNLFSLPLMNTVGLFLEESEERDYGGILSFIFLTYLLVPFQGYAALKGFLEREEGPWFRTPKTGRITDIFTPGRFARLISAIFPGRRVATQGIATRAQGLGVFNFLNPKPYTLNPLLNLRVSRRKIRGLANFVIVSMVLVSIALTYVSFPLTPTLAYTGTFYFRNTSADLITDTGTAGRKQMSTGTLGTTTQSYTLDGTNTTFYVLTDNLNKKWSADKEFPTEGTTSEQRNPDIATDSSGNTFAVWEDERNSQGLGTWATTGTTTYLRYYHSATLSLDGKVLVAGTDEGDGGLSIAEIYDPVSNSWSTTAPGAYGRSYNTASLLGNGKILVIGTRSLNAGQSVAEIYDLVNNSWATTGTLSYGRTYKHAATLLGNGKVLVIGTTALNAGQSVAEIYDPSTNTWSTTASATYARRDHSATLLGNGKVLVTGTSASNAGQSVAELYDPQVNTWSITAALTYIRYEQTATLLNNGKVLVTGTSFANAGRSVAELYDPQTQTFSTTGAMAYGRWDYAAALLNNGKVLVVGTGDDVGQTVAEIYDPSTQTFSTTGTTTYARTENTLTVLSNNKVLVVGTEIEIPNSGGKTIPELYTPKTADIYAQKFNTSGTAQWGSDIRVNSDDGNRSSNGPNYDHLNPRVKVDSSGNPIVVWQEARNSVYGDDIWAQKLNTSGAKQWPASTTGTWSTTGTSTYARDDHTSTLLNNGKVLAVGTSQSNGGQTVAELYDPSAQTWSTTGAMTYPRYYHTATLLTNGKVLAVGMFLATGGHTIPELYDPSTQTWSITGATTYYRDLHTANLLGNGKVLVIGGDYGDGGRTIPEIYDPQTGTWSTTGATTYYRDQNTVNLLGNGKVLVVGTSQNNGGRTIPEIYDPQTGTWSITGYMNYIRYYHTTTLLSSGKVLAVGGDYGDGGETIPEIYDPSTGTWSTTGVTTYGREFHTTTLLSNGKVLVVGTNYPNDGRTTPELYDPPTNTWITTGTATYARSYYTATLLNNGRVLAVGTAVGNGGWTIPEIYTPSGDIQVSNDGSPTNGYGLPSLEHPGMKGILGEQRNPVLAIDSSNNAVVAWEDTRFASMQNWGLSFNYDSNAWRQTNINLAASGACNGGGGTNNSCGAIPLIQNNPLRIMGQKLATADGARQWGDDIDAQNKNNPQDLGLASTGDFSANPSIAADGTNVVVTWESNGKKERDGETRNYDIYGQKFNSNAVSQWGGIWEQKSASPYARDTHTATLLNDGKVLLVGSYSSSGDSIPELFDPATQTLITTSTATYARYSHTATLMGNGKVLVVGTGVENGGQSIPEIYDPSAQTWTTTGYTTYGRYSHTATLLGTGKVLVVGSSVGCPGACGPGTTIPEIYDPATGTWTTTGYLSQGRDSGYTVTLLGSGKVFVLGGNNWSGRSIPEIYDPATGTWLTTAISNYGRYFPTATLLTSGKILMVGGSVTAGRSVPEIYDPQTQTWSTTGTTTYARDYHTTALLPSGRILAVGTNSSNGGQSIAELYDPVTGTWSTTGYLSKGRSYHTATLLSNGKVLVVGSYISGGGRTIPEIYSIDQMISSGVDLADQRNPDVAVDSGSNYIFAWQGRRGSGPGGPYNGDSERGGGSWKIYGQKTNGSGVTQWPNGTAGSWATTAPQTYSRKDHTATLLSNGKTLLTGTGVSNGGQTIAELYDPSTNTFSTTAPSTYGRYDHTATLLNNGKALVVGTNVSNGGQTIAELYDPSTSTFSTTSPQTYSRKDYTATLLSNGKVLLIGTQFTNGGRSIAEIYDPSTSTFSTTSPQTYSRYLHTATLLNNGKVLVTGTVYSDGGQTIAEIYDPSTSTFSTTSPQTYSRYAHTATLLSSGKVLLTGTGDTTGGRSIAEIYDPSTSTFSTTSPQTYSRYLHTATLLSSGKVLLTGTTVVNGGRSIAEIYDPSTSTFSTTSPQTYGRSQHTATLLSNGKVFLTGTGVSNGGQSIAELYNPAGELMMSHDYALKGDQEKPRLAVDGTTIYGVWEDNRSAISNTLTSDKNIFMQKYNTNGEPQWPAASSGAGYESPYAVMDIRAETFRSSTDGWGSHYSGKPAIGGIYTATNGEKPFVLAWEDNRSSGDPMDIYAQSYDTSEQDISKSTNWTAYWDHNLATANLSVNVGITEWDGTTYAEKSQGTAQAWDVSSDPAGEDSLTWTSGGSPPPPSDQIGNITMRRLMVTFTRSSGSVTLYYDDSGNNYDSRLSTGDVVPEKVLILGLIIPFLPPVIQWYRRRKLGAGMRIACEFK